MVGADHSSFSSFLSPSSPLFLFLLILLMMGGGEHWGGGSCCPSLVSVHGCICKEQLEGMHWWCGGVAALRRRGVQ